jgi:hypothetical protein
MQVNAPDIEPTTKVDIGELLLETVKAAPVLPARLIEAVAVYVEFQSAPIQYVHADNKKFAQRIFGMDVKTDPKVPTNSVRFDHPDGRVEGFKIGGKG